MKSPFSGTKLTLFIPLLGSSIEIFRLLIFELIISSLDVIHSFSLPTLGIKVDAIPGRISNMNINGLCSGLYIGYCSELCGSGHAFMPINLIVY